MTGNITSVPSFDSDFTLLHFISSQRSISRQFGQVMYLGSFIFTTFPLIPFKTCKAEFVFKMGRAMRRKLSCDMAVLTNDCFTSNPVHFLHYVLRPLYMTESGDILPYPRQNKPRVCLSPLTARFLPGVLLFG